MTDDEDLRKRVLLDDFAAVQMKLQSLQAALRKESLLLAGIVDCLQRGGECPITVASALDGYLSGPMRDLIQALQDACDEKEALQKMLSESGIKV